MSQFLSPKSVLLPLFPEPLLGPGTELPVSPNSPQWFVLNDTTSGRLHLRLEWLSLIADPEALTEVSARCWGSLMERGDGHVWAVHVEGRKGLSPQILLPPPSLL